MSELNKKGRFNFVLDKGIYNLGVPMSYILENEANFFSTVPQVLSRASRGNGRTMYIKHSTPLALFAFYSVLRTTCKCICIYI